MDASVTVTGEATVLEAARSQIAGTVSEPEVRSLPMNGRNFLELALLVPGVSPTNVASTQLFPETSAVPGVSLSVGSQRNLSNNFIVDGLSANDDAAGLSGITYGVDAVEQFQVVTSGAQAELGRALGGYVNVVTRSGTNVLHGTVYDYFRDDRFNQKNALSGTTLPMDQAQYGGSLGGPLAPTARSTSRTPNSDDSIRPASPRSLTRTSRWSTPAWRSRLSGPTDRHGHLSQPGGYHEPARQSRPSAQRPRPVQRPLHPVRRRRRKLTRSRRPQCAERLSGPRQPRPVDRDEQHVCPFVAHGARDAGAVCARRSESASDGSHRTGREHRRRGVLRHELGRPHPASEQAVPVVNNLSHQAGAHAFRVGVDFLYNDDQITYPRSVRGSYSFSSLANFLAGVYNNAGFTQTFGESDVSQTNPNFGFYVQDEWKVNPRVTLNLGVRYDLQFLETIGTDADNVSPRVGLAWSPFDSRRTLVRGSAGLFYDRVPLRAVANAHPLGRQHHGSGKPPADRRQPLADAGWAPGFPNILRGVVPSVTLVNLTTMDRHLQHAYSRQASLEIEHQIGERATISVGYQYLRGLDLLMSVNQNVPTCVAAGTNNGCRPNPGYANNGQYSSVGDSNYHGLHISFMQRPTRWGHYRVCTRCRSR